MLKLPTPRVVEPSDPGGAWLDAGLELQFENDGEVRGIGKLREGAAA